MILSVFISKRFALVVLDVFHFSVVISFPDLSTPHPDDSNQIGCQKIPVLKSTVGSLSSTLSRSPCSAYSPINCVVIISIMTSVDDMRCHFLIIVRSSCKTKRTCNLQFTRSVMIYVLILL
mmetsp:Transcript_34726/g.46599  ORF Transcript_34726/g.46599 Transcript_34726/m.46599 type:complete len:121 (-) Transcript_34726:87-449(-)